MTSLLHVKYKETRTSSPKETTEFIGRESWRRPTQLCKWPSCFAHIRRESERVSSISNIRIEAKEKTKIDFEKLCPVYKRRRLCIAHTHNQRQIEFRPLEPSSSHWATAQNPTDSRISNQRESQFTLYNRMRKRGKKKKETCEPTVHK